MPCRCAGCPQDHCCEEKAITRPIENWPKDQDDTACRFERRECSKCHRFLGDSNARPLVIAAA